MPYDISVSDAKAFAKRLSTFVSQSGCQLKHTQSLEAVAAMLGYRNFNTLRASLNSESPSDTKVATEGDDHFVVFFSGVFESNHRTPTNPNPQCIYLPAYTTGHLNTLETLARKALAELGRNTVYVDALDKTGLAICEAITNQAFRTAGDGFNAVAEMIAETDTVLVIKGFSEAKMSHKGGFARGLIKCLDDAHIHGRRQEGDVVFVDYASFLEKNWGQIGPYLSIMTSSYPWGL